METNHAASSQNRAVASNTAPQISRISSIPEPHCTASTILRAGTERLVAEAYSPEVDWEIRGEPLPCRLAADQHPPVIVAWCKLLRRLDAFALKYGEDTAGFSQIAPAEPGAAKHGEIMRAHR